MFQRIKTILKSQANIHDLESKSAASEISGEGNTPDSLNSIVARQPVFDLKNRVWGYELLYRKPGSSISSVDGSVATASVIVDGYETVNPGLRDNQSLLINFTESLLETQAIKLLPAETCVAEILETVTPTPEIITAVKELKKSGYRIAVDDFTGQENLLPFLPMADIVKVDVAQLTLAELEREAERLRGSNAIMLAEKVEDRPMADTCRNLGFSLFQGFFFSKPELIQGRRLPASHAARTRILSLCLGDEMDVPSLSVAVHHDPVITAKLLKFANSPYFGLHRNITSIPNALHMIGRVTFLQWICVNMLASFDHNEGAHDMSFLSSMRAKFLESLGIKLRRKGTLPTTVNVQSLFMLGLFSMLESIAQMPLKDVLHGVPVDPGIVAALSGEKSHYLPWLRLIEYYEGGNWDASVYLAGRLGLSEVDLAASYGEAVTWSADFFSS